MQTFCTNGLSLCIAKPCYSYSSPPHTAYNVLAAPKYFVCKHREHPHPQAGEENYLYLILNIYDTYEAQMNLILQVYIDLNCICVFLAFFSNTLVNFEIWSWFKMRNRPCRRSVTKDNDWCNLYICIFLWLHNTSDYFLLASTDWLAG